MRVMSEQQSGSREDAAGGEAAADDAGGAVATESTESTESTSTQSTPSAEGTSTQSTPSAEGGPAPAEQPTQRSEAAPAQEPAQEPARKPAQEPARPRGTERRTPSIDVGELAWKVGNVLATVVRVVALLFAVVIVADIVLTLVGVNTGNGVAQFVGGVSNTVVLAFRDLFLPADPTVFKVVNFGLAAVFWILVGEVVSRLLRFVAARLA